MSTKYKHSHEVPTAVLARRLDELSDAIGKPGEERDRELTRRVPAELDRDADLVLLEASTRLLKMEAEVARLNRQIYEVAGEESVQDQLCARIDDLERDKEVLAGQLDRAEEELAEAKRAQAIMRDTFATQVQQAVSRARRDWAAQGSPWVKAQWQAEALEELLPSICDVADRAEVRSMCAELRRQAEGE